jgi:hypothetical protein
MTYSTSVSRVLLISVDQLPDFDTYSKDSYNQTTILQMQGSRSLFQTGIKLQGQPGATGISKTRPFLNVWSSKDNINSKKHQAAAASTSSKSMASATSIYDFSPLDSVCPLSSSLSNLLLIILLQKRANHTLSPLSPTKLSSSST